MTMVARLDRAREEIALILPEAGAYREENLNFSTSRSPRGRQTRYLPNGS